MSKNRALWSCVIVTFAVVAPLSAQSQIEVGPLVALYAPLGSFQRAPYYSTALPSSPGDLTGAAWGGQARLWFGPRIGVQLQVASASSDVGGGNTPGGSFPPTPARVLTATAQVLWGLPTSHQDFQAWLSGGAGLIRHDGTAYRQYSSPVQLGTAVGFGAAWTLSRHVVANIGVTALLYNIDVSDSTGTSLEHGLQVDPLMHAGLSLRWR